LRPAQHKTVIDLVGRQLHPMRQPSGYMIRVSWRVEYPTHMLDPRVCLGGITELYAGRTIKIEASDALALDPAAIND
jgi:hypothetical protein